jgi:xanthine dehydrogenase accessory factor
MDDSMREEQEGGPDDGDVLERLLKARNAHQPAVLVTVIETDGSTPRKPGAKMLVTPAEQFGSIGGSAVENAVVQRARELLASGGEAEMRRYNLEQDLGMGCGGRMSLFLEPALSAPRLVIFGAGHVGRSISTLAVRTGFSVTVCDSREAWLTAARFPRVRRILAEKPESALKTLNIDARTFTICVTHAHAIDFDIVKRLLKWPVTPRYIGMIGSRRKRDELARHLDAEGFDSATAGHIRIPLGLNIGAVTPEEIAVSVIAELVAVHRDVPLNASW